MNPTLHKMLTKTELKKQTKRPILTITPQDTAKREKTVQKWMAAPTASVLFTGCGVHKHLQANNEASKRDWRLRTEPKFCCQTAATGLLEKQDVMLGPISSKHSPGRTHESNQSERDTQTIPHFIQAGNKVMFCQSHGNYDGDSTTALLDRLVGCAWICNFLNSRLD